MPEAAGQLSSLLPTRGRLALADGGDFPVELWGEVIVLLAERPDVSVLLGWGFDELPPDDQLRAARASTLVCGFGLRRSIDEGRLGFVPGRLSQAPGLVAGVLRPDVLMTSLRPGPGGLHLSTAVSWQRAVLDAGARVACVLRPAAPAVSSGEALDPARVLVLGEGGAPVDYCPPAPSELQEQVAERVAALVPDGVRIQVGPGGIGQAVYAALERPVAIDSGFISDPVVELAERGLLVGEALSPYLAGTSRVYDWAPGRVRLERLERTHDLARLAGGQPLVAINTALEIDLDGQVNAELAGGSAAGGIAGQPDYALGASLSRDGLSIMAMASIRKRTISTLVERLSGPVSTPCYDIDLVVTERGHCDLRGLDRSARRRALRRLWGDAAP
jgi:acyl-CoA hydrolase